MEKRNKYTPLVEIIHETARLLENAGGKSALPALERDLILEKLRAVYDALSREAGGSEKTDDFPQHEEGAESGREKPSEEPPDETSLAASPYHDARAGAEPEEKPQLAERENTESRRESTETGNGKKKQPLIVADRISQPRAFRNEALGQHMIREDVSRKLKSKPIDDISRAIGINDKFHYIRELFAGDPDLYEKTIRTLNEAQNFNQAFEFLNRNFDWDMENPSVQHLLELTRRKFITPEDE
ncbi:MAG TPA: hypothetical protein ENN63_03475 [Bacteroidetes bacterium]|nr:hypothetical protein [Bacteroidota bacterium]